MKQDRNWLMLTILAIALIALAGCTGSDPLSTTVGNITLDFQVDDAGGTEYEESSMTLVKVIVNPVTQEGRDSLGGSGIAMLSERFDVDLVSSSNPLVSKNLPVGSYTIDEVDFVASGNEIITLVNHDTPDPMADCIDRVPAIPNSDWERSRIVAALASIPVNQRIFRPGAVITVPSDEAVVHPIRIDSSVLIDAYKRNFTCSDLASACRFADSTPCITSFNAGAFLTELETLDWITY